MPDRRGFLRALVGVAVAAAASPITALLPAPVVAAVPVKALLPDPGISMRMVSKYNIQTDQRPCRIDVLYGYAVVRPNLACRISA